MKSLKRQLALTVALFLLLAGMVAAETEDQALPPTVGLPPELARVLADYEEAWQAKDEKALAALFTADGFVLSNGVLPVRGRQKIEQRYRNSGGPLALRAWAFATEGTTGYIIGGYARRPGDPDLGKFTLTLAKSAEGRWLIRSDMDNDNRKP